MFTFACTLALNRFPTVPVEAALTVVAEAAHSVVLTVQANTARLLVATYSEQICVEATLVRVVVAVTRWKKRGGEMNY